MQVIITSVPHHPELIAELWYDNRVLGEVFLQDKAGADNPQWIIRLYPQTHSQTLPLADVETLIAQAQNKLTALYPEVINAS